jgi:excisionase family DNA binding protein
MPRTKTKPISQPETASLPTTNGIPSEVLTLTEAAAYLRVSESDIIDLIHSQALPARFTGSEWRFLKFALQQWLSAGSPTPQTRKEAQLALAGKYKDDPDLMQICEEAYRQRKRTLTEGA